MCVLSSQVYCFYSNPRPSSNRAVFFKDFLKSLINVSLLLSIYSYSAILDWVSDAYRIDSVAYSRYELSELYVISIFLNAVIFIAENVPKIQVGQNFE